MYQPLWNTLVGKNIERVLVASTRMFRPMCSGVSREYAAGRVRVHSKVSGAPIKIPATRVQKFKLSKVANTTIHEKSDTPEYTLMPWSGIFPEFLLPNGGVYCLDPRLYVLVPTGMVLWYWAALIWVCYTRW